MVTLAVRDSGGGVAEENLGNLFEASLLDDQRRQWPWLAVVRRVAERAGAASKRATRSMGWK